MNSNPEAEYFSNMNDILNGDEIGSCWQKSANRELDSDLIDKIKHSLLSDSIDVQLSGLEELHNLLKESDAQREIRDVLVEFNMIESLSEAMNSLNVPVVRSLMSVLEELILSKLFVSQNRVFLLLKSTLRSTLLFSELSLACELVVSGLELVSKIVLVLIKEDKNLDTFCDLGQLTNVCQTVLKRSTNDLAILQCISQIVYLMLLSAETLLEDNRHITGDEGNKMETFCQLVAELLNNLCLATHFSANFDIDSAICEVSAACMRLFLQITDANKENLELLHSMIKAAMIKLIIPHFVELASIANDSMVSGLLVLLKGLISMYCYPHLSSKIEFSKILVATNFLEVLPSLELRCSGCVQYSVVRSLLVEILVCMSNNELGTMDWIAIIDQSMKSLPEQGTLKRLATYLFRDPICITVIVYNYFLLLSTASPAIADSLFEDICVYVSIMKSPPPAPLFKAIWFCFSVGHLALNENKYIAEKTNNLLISWLPTYDVGNIYSHHPVILYWTFNNQNLFKEFKLSMVDQWIEQENDSYRSELQILLSQSKDALIYFLELLSTKYIEQNYIDKYVDTFVSALQSSESEYVEEVTYDAWTLLPSILKQINHRSEGCIPAVLLFCFEFQSASVDQGLLIQVCSSIPNLIPNDGLSSGLLPTEVNVERTSLNCATVFKFLSVILSMLEEQNENTVGVCLLNQENFIVSIERSLKMGSNVLTFPAVEVISILLHFQHKHSITSCRNIVIAGSELVHLLYSESHVVVAAVKMLYVALEVDDFTSSTCFLCFKNFLEYLRIVYVRLHMIAFMDNETLTSWCWTCLEKLLKYAESSGSYDLTKHLACLPYSHTLIQSSSRSASVSKFLCTWLPNQTPATDERCLETVMLDRTLNYLSNDN